MIRHGFLSMSLNFLHAQFHCIFKKVSLILYRDLYITEILNHNIKADEFSRQASASFTV